MTAEPKPANLGRSFWMSIISIILQAILAALASTQSKDTTVATAAVGGMATVATAYCAGRAYQTKYELKFSNGSENQNGSAV